MMMGDKEVLEFDELGYVPEVAPMTSTFLYRNEGILEMENFDS